MAHRTSRREAYSKSPSPLVGIGVLGVTYITGLLVCL